MRALAKVVWGVDVAHDSGVVDIDDRNVLANQQLARAGIAFEGDQAGGVSGTEGDRMAALSLITRRDNGLGRSEPVGNGANRMGG